MTPRFQVNPSDLLSIQDVLEAWPGKFTANELRTAMRDRTISYCSKRRKRFMTAQNISDYLERQMVDACPSAGNQVSSNSVASGSTKSQVPTSSIDFGMTPEIKESAAEALALKILKRPNKHSPCLSSTDRHQTDNPQSRCS